jgi:hypothetical protein
LPDGLFAGSAVQPHLQKYFRSRLNQIKTISLAVLSHTEGRIAIVTDVGSGMRWTRQRRARDGLQGGLPIIGACERLNGALTNDAIRGRRSRVVLAPVAGVKFAEARRPDRALTSLNPLMTLTTKNSLTGGEHEVSR